MIFGRESVGLPTDLRQAYPHRCVCIPMHRHLVRSLNLANSVAVGVYEALRGTGDDPGSPLAEDP